MKDSSYRLMRFIPILCLLSSTFQTAECIAKLLEEDFSEGFGIFSPLTDSSWTNEDEGQVGIAALITEGIDRPPVRRPREFMLLEKMVWKDYDYSIKAQTRESSSIQGRDIVIIFGYEDYSHFYYAHISSDNIGSYHNVIVKVTGETRSLINVPDFPETRLTDDWHDIRVTHLSNGEISIYVDDMDVPLMQAFDTTYSTGAIGFGSFDDTAWFDDARIEGELVNTQLAIYPDKGDNSFLQISGSQEETVMIESSTDLLNWSFFQAITIPKSGEPLFLIRNKTEQKEIFYRAYSKYPLIPLFD
ncbi:hypothetical protein MLD52_02240 [Puniceicoccaceae bacterium K14]|nr:hypothetical protein [Puniceicoccaceae bacterium K14]